MQRLTPQERTEMIPVSFAQEHLLRTYRRFNPGAAYNISGAVRILSRLDIDAVKNSANQVIHRHEVLRTHFGGMGDEFIQLIDEQPSLDFILEDLSARSESERTVDARRLLTEIAQTPFDIWASPLIRIGLCKVASDDYFLIFVLHHLVSDGWSLQNLAGEFEQLYASMVRGLPPQLAPLPFQYADFAIWQRKRFQGSFLDHHIAYWTQYLKDAPLLELPTDRPRPNISSFAGQSRTITLSRETSAAARQFAAKERMTLFTLLFATFAAVLSERSGQKDVVIGTPIGTRAQPGMDKLIGFLINTMPLRINFSSITCFRDLFRQVREITSEALTHHELPLVRLESELERRRGATKHLPLFRVVFAMQNVPRERRSTGGLNTVAVDVDVNTARRDLTFFVYDWNDSVQGVMEYSTDLFAAETIEGLLRQFEQFLTYAVANPDAPIFIGK